MPTIRYYLAGRTLTFNSEEAPLWNEEWAFRK